MSESDPFLAAGTPIGSDPFLAAGTPIEKPEQDLVGKLAGGAMDFTESSLGIGDELGAIGQMIGGSVYDVFNTDKDLSKVLADNFQWGSQIDRARDTLDTFEEQNPVTSGVLTGAGILTGLAVPAATLSKGGTLAKAATAAGEGAAYGFAAGRDEGRVDGLLLGGALGGAAGAAGAKIGEKLTELRARPDGKAADEAEALGEWAEKEGGMNKYDQYVTGVSDAIRRRVSEEAGLRVQRADETAMRQNSKEMKEVIQNKPMQEVISLADNDETFKGMLLDFAQHANFNNDDLIKYVRKELGSEQAAAMQKYLSWSQASNAKYNRRLGNNEDAAGYLHTQKERGLPKQTKQKTEFGDDEVNIPAKDRGDLERVRGLVSKGEVRVKEYANPLVTNMIRIQNNNRLLQLQQKFGVDDINGGAPQLVDEIQKAIQKKGISKDSAIDGRNAIVSLIKGQNKVANNYLQLFQNLSYAGTLAGPKSSILNIHDLPVAAWNNGLGNMMKAYSKRNREAGDLSRLGIDNQSMGEFTQAMRREFKSAKGFGESAAAGSKALTTGLFKAVQFERADRLGKTGVLGTVASRLRSEAKSGKFTDEFAAGFDDAEKARLAKALNESGGDINKMSKKDLELYDEALTLGLGQQQLISAAGRPELWLNHPSLRPLFMLRGFAIKQNALLARKVYEEFKKGNMGAAAKAAGGFIALPGASYAALNVGRNELFKEDYEASGEEFMYSMLDSVLGPLLLNTVGTGSSYARQKFSENPVKEAMISLLPPGGLTENTVKAISKAVDDEDPEALAEIITKTPAYKQFAAAFDKID